jgi:hypothetical protein
VLLGLWCRCAAVCLCAMLAAAYVTCNVSCVVLFYKRVMQWQYTGSAASALATTGSSLAPHMLITKELLHSYPVSVRG